MQTQNAGVAETGDELFCYKDLLQLSMAICMVSPQGIILQVNELFCRFSGFSSHQLTGQHYTILKSSQHPHAFFKKLWKMVQKGDMWHGEICFKASDGTLFWLDNYIVPVYNGNGQVTRYISAGHKVTHYKQEQQWIQSSEQALREAQTVANLGSWTYELQNNRIIWSEQVFKIYGLHPQSDSAGSQHETALAGSDTEQSESWQAVGASPVERRKNTIKQPMHGPNFTFTQQAALFQPPTPQQLLALYHPEDKPIYERAVNEAIQLGKPFDLDLRIITPALQLKYINLKARPLFAHNKRVTHVHGTVMDISIRKQAEIELHKQNLELKKINEQLDRFVYSAAHDLRAPLMSLLGVLDLLTDESDLKEQELYIQLMKRSIYRLDSFIQDIIHFSRNGRTPILSEQIELDKLFEQIWSTLSYAKTTQGKSGREIDFQISKTQSAPFCSDVRRISIVLSNLLSNVIRYCDPEKERMSASVLIAIDQKGATIVLTDNGIGIAEQHLESIFTMFYRASEAQSGSGLGLYIVKQIVTTLSGSIHVESTLGSYTRFTLFLPAIDQKT